MSPRVLAVIAALAIVALPRAQKTLPDLPRPRGYVATNVTAPLVTTPGLVLPPGLVRWGVTIHPA